MKGLFAMDSKPVRVMSRVGDLMLLNLLLLFCSLPVITFGAALTAAYDMTLRILRDEDEGTVKGFFRAFRANWKPATKLWLAFLAVIAVCVGDLFAARLPELSSVRLLLTAAAGIQAVLLLAFGQYAFALTARFDNSLGMTLKNSAIFALCRLPETLAMMLISSSAVLIFLFVPLPSAIFPCFVTLCILIWFGGELYLNSILLRRIFQKQFGSEETERQREARLRAEALYALDGVKGEKVK